MELLIYIGIFAIVAMFLTGVLVNVLRVQERETAVRETTRQSQFVMRRIQSLIRESIVIEAVYEGENREAACVNFCSIRIRTRGQGLNPTIISSDINGVYLREGTAAQVALTTGRVRVNNLIFTMHQNPGGFATVSVDLALVHNSENPALRIINRLVSAVSRASAATFDGNLLPDAHNLRDIGQDLMRWRHLFLQGNLIAAGTKSFVKEHPTDSSKNIVYVSLEGPEVGTYIRGTAVCRNNEAVIVFPDYFYLVTHDDGLTAQLTPRLHPINLFIKELDNSRLVIGCDTDGKFDYWVNGLRRGFEDHQVIQERR